MPADFRRYPYPPTSPRITDIKGMDAGHREAAKPSRSPVR